MIERVRTLLGGENPTSQSHGPLDLDTVFGILENQRRRAVLRVLDDYGGDGVELGHLAEVVAAREHGIAPDDVTSDQRKRVYIALHQTHLPKMAEAGVVEHDVSQQWVWLGDRADQLLAHLPDRGDRR